MATRAQIDQMRERITDEIFLAMGISKSGLLRRVFGRLFYLPTQRFSTLFAGADEATAQGGLYAGSQVLKAGLEISVRCRGADSLPLDGPLLVVSNHPGAYDSVAYAANIPRTDLRLIALDVPFYHALPHIGQRLILAPKDPTGRMSALREAIQHLQQGGALHHFATGKIDPDPESLPGADEELELWSPSIEIMLRKAPDTKVVLAMISGVLQRRFAYHPITRLRRFYRDRRRLAEFTQVIWQLISPRNAHASANVSFAEPVSVAQLEEEAGGKRLLPAILARAHRLLAEHQQFYGIPPNPIPDKQETHHARATL